MNRIFVTIACLLLLPLAGVAADSATKPNFVFVLVDDLRWDDLRCTGNTFVKTPNIDRIAGEGCQFTNAFSTTPLCSPSRACIFSGQYAHANGIIDNTERGPQSHAMKTFPQELQKAGYKTAFIGKWHMGNDSSRRPGFDRWFCLQGQGSTFDPVVNDDGKERQVKGYVTDVVNEQSLDFLSKPQGAPFLLYVSHKAIHPEVYQGPDGKLSDPTLSNYIPAPRHEKLYEGVTIPRRKSNGVPPVDKPALMQKLDGVPPLGPDTGTSDKVILNRLRMLAAVDEGVGQLIEALEKSGQLDNTVFIITSDHGYFYGEHGLSVERRLPYEESIRIPLLVRYPKLVKPGSTVDQMAITLDVAPTLVELGGGQIPAYFQGRSLVPLLAGNVVDGWRNSYLIEYYSDIVFPRMNKMAYKAVRGDRWKYVHYIEHENADELYDLKNDPYELKNLINDPASQAPLAEMKAELQRLLAESQPSAPTSAAGR